MPDSAPRFPWPLVETIRTLAGSERTIAQIWRDAGAFAERSGFCRPSYEHVRRLVHRQRALNELPTASEAVLDGWLRVRSPQNAMDVAIDRARARRAARAEVDAERVWRPDGRGAA